MPKSFRCVLLLLCLSADLRAQPQVDGGAGPSDAGKACATSSECASPLPHCDPTRKVCVECLGDRNCAPNQVCKLDEGVCVECRSDADCTSLRPYCNVLRNECVECTTSANCGNIGLACQDGKCGSCGDGICGPREGIQVGESAVPGGPVSPDGRVACFEDCKSLCPTRDAGSGFGTFTVSTTGLRDLFTTFCGEAGGVDASFGWKAPYTGSFTFSASNLTITRFEGGCSGFLRECNSGGGLVVSLSAGDEIVVIIDAGASAPPTIDLEITDANQCDGGPCGPGSSGDGGGKQGSAICLANAVDRGEPTCSGVECACNHCPSDYDDCAVIPGCGEIRECMRQKACVGADCYNSGACRGVIDSFGSISGPAFRAGAALQSCTLTFACELPCNARDAGPVDAGQLCTPNRTVACQCGNRSGTQRCSSDGMQFGPCNCASPADEASDGCGCRLSELTRTGSTLLALGLLLLLGGARHQCRAKRSRREEGPS